MSAPLRGGRVAMPLDWGQLSPLRFRARHAAAGFFAGGHRSHRRGAGVEFGGHRAYVPGDDLRFLDRRAMLRHGRLLIREFETETDRQLCLVVDATRSMGFRSADAPGAKLAFAAVIAAALGRVALAGGDGVSLDWIGGSRAHALPPASGGETFERLLFALESVQPDGDLTEDRAAFDAVLALLARRARRGAVIVWLSDLLDLPAAAPSLFAALGTRGRAVVAVRVLDPVEATFPFPGAVRLEAVEGDAVVETDGAQARAGYLAALEASAERWRRALGATGGTLVTATTDDEPVSVVRRVLLAAQGGAA